MSVPPRAAHPIVEARRALASPLLREEDFAAVLGGGRGDPAAIARYLAIPLAERPNLTPFFDRAFYLALYPDVAEAGVDALFHFLDVGLAELRTPHPLIDPRYISAIDPLVLGNPATPVALAELLEFDLAAPSPYFDPAEYRDRLGNAAPPQGMLRHFLTEGLAAHIAPNPFIDLDWYMASNADASSIPYVALRHFITVGDAEGRSPGPRFDGRLYRSRYPDVAASRMPPLLHYLAHGRGEGRQLPADIPAAPARPRDLLPPGTALPVDPAAIAAAYPSMRAQIEAERQRRRDAVEPVAPPLHRTNDVRAALAGLRFPPCAEPKLSILVPVFNELDVTADCLLSIRDTMADLAVEVVVADDCSTDPDAALLARIPGLTLVRGRENLGFIRNCNSAFTRCRGDYVLLLNNDAQLLPGALARMVAALDADERLGAVGPKILYPNGRLQEAGCYLKPNGESGMVGLFADPNEPGFCHDRDVAYISGAALMIRRRLAGPTLFDEAYLPAYCEDADLCLRLIDAGYRIRYLHEAVAVHHLSVSTNRQSVSRKMRTIVANQQKLVERWGPLIRKLDRIRVLAFYLPQFHPTPENDLWWGRGFTEWTNVAKAVPSYEGHYQPHLPADLGFYDLRSADALRAQAELAARYGIDGFCVYYYNFGARRVLHKPIETVRANPDIPFHWCLCWANENWTRHWDGGEKSILLEQRYDDETLAAIVEDAVAQATDDRYIRVDGKPLVLVYRPLLLPDPAAFAARCRAAFDAAGFPGVHLAYVESMEAVNKALRPADIGFDAAIEFPPHGLAVPAEDSAAIVKDGWSGYRYDYPATVAAFVTRDSVPYPRYPAIFPSWDNTPRQPMVGTSFDNTSPAAFRAYAEAKIDEIRDRLTGEERLLFVNAWNEWAEGAHLEPDTGHGHQRLAALAAARMARQWS